MQNQQTSIKIIEYDKERKIEWNNFVDSSRNGTFLINRNYMDYHSDRFVDNSLMFYDDKDKLLAVLPANIKDQKLYSHQGLTYGGLILDKKATQSKVLDVFETLINYIKKNNIKELIYKKIPYIYESQPCEEDIYALFRNNAELIRCDSSSVVILEGRYPFNKGKKYNVSKAKKENIEVSRSYDLESFMNIEEKLLKDKYDTKPVHSLKEITSLAEVFPNNIKLFGAFKDKEMLAGVIIYETKLVAHAQYIASSDKGKEFGAVDIIIKSLLDEIYKDKRYFDFGISTEDSGRYLNQGLIAQKEGFGGRSVTYNSYIMKF